MEAGDSYLTIAAPAEAASRERSSKFLAYAYPVQTTRDRYAKYSTPCARDTTTPHTIAMRGGSGPGVSISAPMTTGSLRGRPGGRSSGQLLANSLTDCLVVVVRYFGGTKLGVPGLIAAYRESAAAAIGAARIVERTVDRTVRVDFPYIVLNNIMRVVKEQQPKIVSQEFDNLCTMVFAIREGRAAELIEKLKKAGGSVPEEQ